MHSMAPCGRGLAWLAIAILSAAGTVAAESPPPAGGVYTSAIYESEAAMLQGEGGAKHGCWWKGREKKQGKLICKAGFQLKCGRRGWYKTGPC